MFTQSQVENKVFPIINSVYILLTQPHLEVTDDERRQASQLEALKSVVLVGLVLLLRGAIELGQEASERHLGDDVLPCLVRVQGWGWQVTRQVQPLDLFQVSWTGMELKCADSSRNTQTKGARNLLHTC